MNSSGMNSHSIQPSSTNLHNSGLSSNQVNPSLGLNGSAGMGGNPGGMGHGMGIGSGMGVGHGHFAMNGLNASPEASRATASGPYWQQQMLRAEVSPDAPTCG
jgi:hypothetical protein